MMSRLAWNSPATALDPTYIDRLAGVEIIITTDFIDVPRLKISTFKEPHVACKKAGKL